MPRPTSKSQLSAGILKERAALNTQLEALTPEQMTRPGTVGEWSVKDVLAHLLAWEQMCLAWYEAGKRGETPQTPGQGYTWQQIPALNQNIYERHRDTPLETVMEQFRASYEAIFAAIEAMTDEELFTPKVYKWTKSTTLGSYMTSATCSHYHWAWTEIRKGLKGK